MTDKDLKNLSKNELYDILIAQMNENRTLLSQVAHLNSCLNDRTIAVKDIGSIAEAALAVNGVFTAAQKAADQYLASAFEMNASTEKRCQEMIEQTRQYCQKLENDTRYKCAAMETDAKNHCAALLSDAKAKAKFTLSGITSALRDYYLANEDKLRELPADLQRLILSSK